MCIRDRDLSSVSWPIRGLCVFVCSVGEWANKWIPFNQRSAQTRSPNHLAISFAKHQNISIAKTNEIKTMCISNKMIHFCFWTSLFFLICTFIYQKIEPKIKFSTKFSSFFLLESFLRSVGENEKIVGTFLVDSFYIWFWTRYLLLSGLLPALTRNVFSAIGLSSY